MGKHKDQATSDSALDLAYREGWNAAVRKIKELAEDSDWVRVSDIEEMLG